MAATPTKRSPSLASRKSALTVLALGPDPAHELDEVARTYLFDPERSDRREHMILETRVATGWNAEPGLDVGQELRASRPILLQKRPSSARLRSSWMSAGVV